MNPNSTQIRDQQKDVWNKFSPGWKKWDEFNMAFLKTMGDEIIAALKLPGPATVLDLATGTGEPGLTIAKAHPAITVIGADLADGMLAIAAAHAQAAGLKNYRTQVADVCALPFADSSIGAISCRLGYMFFPDMAVAAREIVRVLEPGGRFATSVWNGREKNPWVTTMMHPIMHHGSLPAPDPLAPGMFRCAAPGMIAGLLREAGLQDVTDREIFGQVTFDHPEQYWSMMMEVAAPVVAAMSKLDESTRAVIKAEVFDKLQRPGGIVAVDYRARIIAGRK
jgi:ubiquinone/menaquinone biosynthesis C-methylase UbiE